MNLSALQVLRFQGFNLIRQLAPHDSPRNSQSVTPARQGKQPHPSPPHPIPANPNNRHCMLGQVSLNQKLHPFPEYKGYILRRSQRDDRRTHINHPPNPFGTPPLLQPDLPLPRNHNQTRHQLDLRELLP